MKANELRIGNYYNQFGYTHQATGSTISELEKAPESQLWCKPIPLDESWLIRCKQFTRWDYFGDENYGGYFNLWGPWKLMVRHFKSGFVVSIVTIDRKRMCYRLVKEIDLKVSYVHQLQNFIWSARQEELQFAEE